MNTFNEMFINTFIFYPQLLTINFYDVDAVCSPDRLLHIDVVKIKFREVLVSSGATSCICHSGIEEISWLDNYKVYRN